MKKVLFISLLFTFAIFYSCNNNDPVVVVLTTTSNVLNLDVTNANQSLSISSNSTWSAKSSENWCTLSDSVGKGNKSIVLLCSDNLSGTSRQTNINIQAGDQTKTVVVIQAGGLVLLDENFNDNALNWIGGNDSLLENINNGFFDIKNVFKNVAYFVGTRSMITNFTSNYMIMTDYHAISGTAPFGLTFGFKDNQNFYRILVYPQGSYLVSIRTNNISTTLMSGPATSIKSENAISLVKIGKNCDLYINGIKIGSFDLSTPYGPYVGFYSCPQTEIYVDYLKVLQF